MRFCYVLQIKDLQRSVVDRYANKGLAGELDSPACRIVIFLPHFRPRPLNSRLSTVDRRLPPSQLLTIRNTLYLGLVDAPHPQRYFQLRCDLGIRRRFLRRTRY
jgi:hypothetical protein